MGYFCRRRKPFCSTRAPGHRGRFAPPAHCRSSPEGLAAGARRGMSSEHRSELWPLRAGAAGVRLAPFMEPMAIRSERCRRYRLASMGIKERGTPGPLQPEEWGPAARLGRYGVCAQFGAGVQTSQVKTHIIADGSFVTSAHSTPHPLFGPNVAAAVPLVLPRPSPRPRGYDAVSCDRRGAAACGEPRT
jgi:hypothetical protein